MSDSKYPLRGKYPPRVTTNPGKVNPEPGKVTVTLADEEARSLHPRYAQSVLAGYAETRGRALNKLEAAIKEAAAPAPDLDVVLVPGKDVMRFLEWHRKSREGRGTSVARADRDALDRLHAALDRTEKGTR